MPQDIIEKYFKCYKVIKDWVYWVVPSNSKGKLAEIFTQPSVSGIVNPRQEPLHTISSVPFLGTEAEYSKVCLVPGEATGSSIKRILNQTDGGFES